jgi:two-component system OmpR family response regulator
MKILLVEDDEDTADCVSRGLREQGHAVDVATNGRDGLLLAVVEEHDVLIVDRKLPGLVRMIGEVGVRAPVAVFCGARRCR